MSMSAWGDHGRPNKEMDFTNKVDGIVEKPNYYEILKGQEIERIYRASMGC